MCYSSGMRALGVIRLSKSTDESTSPERQRSTIGKRAESDGHEVVAWAEDLDVSGSVPAADRPQLGQYLTPAGLATWDVMIAAKLDRVSRNFLDFVSLLELLKANGKTIVAVGEGIDTGTDTGRLVAQILASIAEFERAQIRARVNDRTMADLMDGVWRGEHYPSFLAPVRDGANKWRLRLTDDADRYREAIAMIHNGKTIAEAGEHVGIERAGMGKLLRSRILVGDRELPDGRVVRSASGAPVAYAEPLISRQEYERLQAELNGRLGKPRVSSGTQLLSGVVKCSFIQEDQTECGRPRTYNVARQGEKSYPRWVCIPGHGTVPDRELSEAFADEFLYFYGDAHLLESVYHPGDSTAEELAELDRLMAELREERSLYRAAEFREMYEPLAARREHLEANPGRPAQWEVRETERTIRKEWTERLTDEAKNEFLRYAGVQVFARRGEGGRGSVEMDVRIPPRTA